MANAYKVLGQAAPAATTEADLGTVGTGKSWIASTLVVCNRGGAATTFRVSVAAGGGATADKDYLYYDVTIPANDTFCATLGLTLSATDVVRVYAGNANLSFSLFGTEAS